MNIVVDCMGGDHGPSVVVQGAVEALKEGDGQFSILLAGNESRLQKELRDTGFSSPYWKIHPTTQLVEMTDRPSQIIKTKPDSSLVAGIRLVQEGKAEAFVSAGNTGAVLSAAHFSLGRIEGVRRPALGVYFPVDPRGFLLCDAGANVEAKPHHLLQFAIMASEYMKHVQGVEEPTVGLLNIGEEPTKGQEVYVKAYELMKGNLPSFRGNIESRYLLDGLVDVVVCDGFVGNNLMKFAEGWIQHVSREVSKQLRREVDSEALKELFYGIFSHVLQEYDYEEYGGVPLLGVNGICIVCHGSSPARAIKNAIFAAKKSIEEKLVDSIRKGISATVSLIESTTQET